MSQLDNVKTLLAGSATLTALVGTRIHPYIKKSTTAGDYITFQSITEVNNNLLNGPPIGRNIRWQFNCYSSTPNGAEAIGNAVEGALRSTGHVVFRQATYDADAQLFWAQIDWSTFVDAA